MMVLQAKIKALEGKRGITVGLKCGIRFGGQVTQVSNAVVTMACGPSHAQETITFPVEEISYIKN